MVAQTATFAQHATLSTTTADVITFINIQTLTLTSAGAGDSFTLGYNNAKTVPFVIGTNGTAAAIQAALRTATGDTGLTVSGTTDIGPFTVTFVQPGHKSTLEVLDPTGMSVAVAAVDPGGRKTVRVSNKDASVALYFNINSATVPTSAADDTYYVAAGTSLPVFVGSDINTVRLVGNANAYGVEIA